MIPCLLSCLLIPLAPFLLAADLTLSLADVRGKPVEHAVLAARPTGGGAPPVQPGRRVRIEQKDKTFLPLVTVITVGTEVEFPNLDSVQHHVYSFSQAKTFDIPLYKDAAPSPVVFGQPGVVVLGCNIHDWMKAYVYVSDTPFVGMSGPDGQIRLTGVPAGTYALDLWHPRLRKVKGNPLPPTVTLREGPATLLSTSLELKKEIAPRQAPTAREEGYR